MYGIANTFIICRDGIWATKYDFCGFAGGCAFEGFGKENDSDILKVCYPRCIRAIDMAHLR